MDNQPPPEVVIEQWTGDIHISLGQADPEIPHGSSRVCPQCDRYTWKRSRWCWYCKFDFDRAALAKLHPTKVLAVALFVVTLWLLFALLER